MTLFLAYKKKSETITTKFLILKRQLLFQNNSLIELFF